MFRLSEKKSKSGSHKRISKKFRKRVMIRYMNNVSEKKDLTDSNDYFTQTFSEDRELGPKIV